MRPFFFLTLILFLSCNLFSQETKSPYLSNKTYTYSELIAEYKNLANQNDILQLKEIGMSDIGKPIHLVIIDKKQNFSSIETRKEKRAVLFINNGIHSGEACGIDASVELSKKLLNPKHTLHKMLDSVVVVLIPVYNVGGMLNRGSYSRANQNGPEEHGFRGNAQNLDLNRDFIKVDSRNAEAFTKVFREWDPDIFIDTHTTNGSDHQYTLTLIATQKDKQSEVLASYAEQKILPSFYESMASKKMEMIPYVYNMSSSPDKGIMAFMETPRYSSGYASLFDCFSFITEAHVFKTFEERVKHTIGFLETVVEFTSQHTNEIITQRRKAKSLTQIQEEFPIKWELDTTKHKNLPFSGYETTTQKSEVTGQDMRFYDRKKPYKKEIKYFDSYKPVISVSKPDYYVVPQAYQKVIDRLKWNGVKMKKLKRDTSIEVGMYYIVDYKSTPTAYEAHFLHYNIEVKKKVGRVKFYQGDYLIPTNQHSNRYIVETLEAQSVDGFFAWNFFDGILQQKEWFSDYAFEPKAAQLLKDDVELRKEFEAKKKEDETFAKDNWAQLYYIYKRSPYYEKTVNRFPIYRIE